MQLVVVLQYFFSSFNLVSYTSLHSPSFKSHKLCFSINSITTPPLYYLPPPVMDARGLQRKSALKEKMNRGFIAQDDMDNDVMEEEEEGFGSNDGFADDERKRKVNGKRGSGGGVLPPSCQVERCGVDLTDAKRYHRRHKVCEVHAKAPVVTVAGLRQRFCQQCSRFHELSEFDEAKRSCRSRLAGHNERRRKSAESSAEGSSRRGISPQMMESQCRQVDDRCRLPMAITGNPSFKRSQYQ